MNEYNIDFFVSNRNIMNDTRIDDVMKHYLIFIRDTDQRNFRYSYETFLMVNDYKEQINKKLSSWKNNDYKMFFNSIKKLSNSKNNLIDKTYIYLNKFFSYCEDLNIKEYIYSNEVLFAADIKFENISPILTFKDFNVIIKFLKETISKEYSFYYYVAMFSLIYYGVSIYDLHEYTYEDFKNGKYLYSKIEDEYILQCIKRSKNVTTFQNKYTVTLDNTNPDVICKPTLSSSKSRNRLMQQYKKRLLIGLGIFKHIYSLSPTNINKSGAFYFFTRECIEKGLDIKTDLLVKRMESEKRCIYEELANKYRLQFTNIKSKYKDWILKIYNEEFGYLEKDK